LPLSLESFLNFPAFALATSASFARPSSVAASVFLGADAKSRNSAILIVPVFVAGVIFF
jgi:hypothetical protein